jgi:hypothetical protein
VARLQEQTPQPLSEHWLMLTYLLLAQLPGHMDLLP